MKPFALITLAAACLMLSLAGCFGGHVDQNLEDGYQPGDISEGVKADVAWYCGEGLMGIRKIARVTVSFLSGKPIPDLCMAKDAILGDE